MRGVVIATGSCWICGQLFTMDPDLVPSVPIDPETNLPPDLGGDEARARRQPICAECVEHANTLRERQGRPLIVVPRGAYPIARRE